MSAFAKFKANRQETTAKLTDLVTNGNKKSYETDTRYWQLKPDPKTKTGNAIIRFLPTTETDEAPFVTLYEHAFNRAGGWYINKSRSTLGKDEKDPVLEYNEKLWKSGNPADKLLVSGDDTKGIKASKRKKYYISNIYVVKHDAQPEDEGKVFLFKYGQKIMDKIKEQLIAEVEGEETCDVHDFWNGKNFLMKMSRQGNYANYDQSKFLSQSSVLGGDDDKLEALWKTQYSLAAEIAEDKFKSYEQLQKELTRALGGVAQSAQAGRKVQDEDQFDSEDFNESRPTNSRPKFNAGSSDDDFFSTVKNGSVDDEDSIPF